MNKEEYQEYLKSDWWQKRRLARGWLSNWTCDRCNINGIQMHIHHLSYDRIGAELDEDLECICWICHAKEHNKIPVYKPINFKESKIKYNLSEEDAKVLNQIFLELSLI